MLRPLVNPATYRGWLWVIVGGALVMPFVLLGEVVRIVIWGESGGGVFAIAGLGTFAVMLPLVLATGLVLPVAPASKVLARSLLGATVPSETGTGRSRDRRWRDAVWLTIHLGVGGLLSGVTLALVPFLVMIGLLPILPERGMTADVLSGVGWQDWWGPIVAPLTLAAFIYLIAGVGVLMRTVAERLLGPTAAERLDAARRHSRRLAERNQLARELHDSVGHSLSVVTIQADAAARVLTSDPDFASRALSSISESARRALEELDQVLKVLREEGDAGDTRPAPTLSGLPELLADSGVVVTADIDPVTENLPAHLSREAYRIVQEGLTNALRYGDGTAHLVVSRNGTLHIELTNPIAVSGPVTDRDSRDRTGYGRTGLAERATILGGRLTAGPVVGESDHLWRVTAELPIPSGS
ncbi:signal transduction histidine kinase [Stackebrandtia endophytica]|uniref:histidine kinase n=1 Tax=Stackebrandtia endophytica TaxID=1496996 RepID=A0A543AQU7_9ACTN|nr:histidine kinase [Stackebrandtia endophytica]TQL74961.1 signal transduction histidine kinase [Stackebrandtia endophytica]